MTRRPFAVLPRITRTPLGWVYVRWARRLWLFTP
jgi:hypothetical protein